ncbi:hypothetical protein Droror1_Dr00007988 [Drosera rotundifolia]
MKTRSRKKERFATQTRKKICTKQVNKIWPQQGRKSSSRRKEEIMRTGSLCEEKGGIDTTQRLGFSRLSIHRHEQPIHQQTHLHPLPLIRHRHGRGRGATPFFPRTTFNHHTTAPDTTPINQNNQNPNHNLTITITAHHCRPQPHRAATVPVASQIHHRDAAQPCPSQPRRCAHRHSRLKHHESRRSPAAATLRCSVAAQIRQNRRQHTEETPLPNTTAHRPRRVLAAQIEPRRTLPAPPRDTSAVRLPLSAAAHAVAVAGSITLCVVVFHRGNEGFTLQLCA